MANQLTVEALRDMSPEEIMQAKKEGRLNAILGRPVDAGATQGGAEQ